MTIEYPADAFDFNERPLSYSSLKHILTSPRHFAHYRTSDREPPSSAQVLGSIVDCLLLEPEKFADRFRIAGNINRRTNAGKEEYAALIAEVQEKKMLLITQEDKEKAQEMVESIKLSAMAEPVYMNTTNVQVKMELTDKVTGLPVIGYADGIAFINDKPVIWDLKTAADASGDAFQRDAHKYSYWLQAAIYQRAYAQKSGVYADFYFMVVENKPPYGVNLFRADSDFMEFGHAKLRQALDIVDHCRRHDSWGEDYSFLDMVGYNQLTVPRWAKID